MKTIRFGIIGCGLMGREFASAAARWFHLPEMTARPVITAVCDANEAVLGWYTDNLPSISLSTTDYKELLASDEVDAVYVAVPHNLHQQVYCDVIEAGKHLMGEKPFGIDKPANDAILDCIEKHPDVFVRCSSEFPFFPTVQRICRMIDSDAFGQLLEVNGFFQHSSDLDPDKAINWKRMIDKNGEYGCMGDLGMHVCHMPFRAGWLPQNVRAVLSNVMTTRPDASGKRVPCETWDNATLLCEAAGSDGKLFPLTLKTQRIAPGETNSWSLEVKGTKACARFSTKNPRRLEVLQYDGGEQVWGQLDMGHETAFKSITGGIFEFGFSDGILQMWAGFVHELAEGSPLAKFAACATPQETAWSHIVFTAALESQARQTVVEVELT
jgi:predicted dehydrogenase